MSGARSHVVKRLWRGRARSRAAVARSRWGRYDAWVTTSPQHHYVVSATPLPSVPWLRTGNRWLALPCIHPADGSLHALGMLHRGARAAVEFAGGPGFADGNAQPLARLAFYLIAPTSDDGLTTWNVLDDLLGEGTKSYPILRKR